MKNKELAKLIEEMGERERNLLEEVYRHKRDKIYLENELVTLRKIKLNTSNIFPVEMIYVYDALLFAQDECEPIDKNRKKDHFNILAKALESIEKIYSKNAKS